jgi:uncharacterized membrane protein YbhN (UPF0104 family)
VVAWCIEGWGRLAGALAVGDAAVVATVWLTVVLAGIVEAGEHRQGTTGARLTSRQTAQGVIEWIVMVAIAVAIAFAAIKVLGPVVSQKVTDIAACFGATGKGPFGAGTCTLGS